MKKNRLVWTTLSLIASVIVIATMSPKAGAQETSAINGRIVDVVSGAPITGVQVLLVNTTRGTLTAN